MIIDLQYCSFVTAGHPCSSSRWPALNRRNRIEAVRPWRCRFTNPCDGLQFFGHFAIDGATEAMTVTLKDVGDQNLWSTKIEPKMA
jgi:hypothetical protein